jgi:dihydrofolate reductase
MRPEIVLVVAVADNDVIGNDGAMPWHLPADLRHFRRLTVGKPVVMGRKTFESIGKPLPGRHNIVLTRQRGWSADGVTVVPNLAEAIAAAGMNPNARAPEIMVIGGAQIYAEALPIATRVELTRIHVAPEGDTVFPPLDPAQWVEAGRVAHSAEDDAPAHDFITLVRRDAGGPSGTAPD